ncbi:MAG: methyltransferase domain-containing protein [Alphaproteobacteria bacterium]|nr:methyltransferase domain-containing protein [Alphaproteobacteria bacterium]
MKRLPIGKRQRGQTSHTSLGPIADLESHLPEEWWNNLFDSLYLMTDGDVVENDINTRREIDAVIAATGMTPQDRIVDLCCGQGRHSMELAQRGFRFVSGIDRSRYLVRLARRRAQDRKIQAVFREADARTFRVPEGSQDYVLLMGNSFGYFASEEDDLKVLSSVVRALRSGGTVVLDITDGEWIRQHFDARSWEWIDQHHFVCRERSLSSDGDRLISREVIVHDDNGVIADQFYAERLYSFQRIRALLERAGFRNVRQHGSVQTHSDRGQDLGMMSHRMLISAIAPRRETVIPKSGKRRALEVAVAMGDPSLPDAVKRGGVFNPEDHEAVTRLKDALSEVQAYRFRYLNNHASLERDLTEGKTDLVLNLCDEGWNNDAFKELHVPALLEMLDMPYTGSGPACLAICYDKAMVRAIATSLDVPVPLETYVRATDQSATLPSIFPAILKPNFGDSSVGITKDAVVTDQSALLDYLERLRDQFQGQPILVQEFLQGDEFSVCLVGNPAQGLRALPILQVDYSGLDPGLPRILGYESKWEPESPYWNQIRYRETNLSEEQQAELVGYAIRLFDRLCCRDYARFDFRANADGEIKLLEANPNPGWVWDGKMNLMAGFAGMRYSDLLTLMLNSARERIVGAETTGTASAERVAELATSP